MIVHNMADREFSKKMRKYGYPQKDGTFYGLLMGARWTTHSVLHTYWRLSDGTLLDCPLFRDTRDKDIELFPDNIYAELTFEKAETSGKIYLRKIIPCSKAYKA